MARLEFELPDPGEGITEGEIVEWYVEEGDQVEEDESLADVETDKAVVEIPVPADGTVEELVADVGDVATVGEVIAVFETEADEPTDQERAEDRGEQIEEEPASTADAEADVPEEEAASAAEATDEPAEATETTAVEPEDAEADAEVTEGDEPVTEELGEPGAVGAETQPATDRVFAPPSTRRYARERGVNISEIDGSGPNGRVLRSDIEAHLSDGTQPEQIGAAEPTAYPEPAEPSEPEPLDVDEERSTRRPLRGLRARIAENMVRSAQTVPHVTSGFEADATELVALKDRLDEKHDVRITYTPILVKAVVPALTEFPIVNASVDDATDEIVEKHYYDIGFATHTDEGLMVPVIRDVNQKSLVDIAEEMGDLAEQARDRSIDLADLQGGTFTVTNVGTHGEHRTFGTPIINHPQAAIMGIGRIREQPVAVDNEVEVRPRIDLTLSYDHRIIDGVTANKFMELIIETIEDTVMLLSRL
ncbi:dihydrolipoamide acetyltransferase family protein [Natronococcus wangiae]|uniref:dihydrolipoamide acetyltransferase family protein n=1 Tax=Natronococcus wangiae TaxID=3068275 RepID=UPI00273E20FF|nr:dihydrolipoamide acetyltransferase family protein [Natronococcus sp. AD5]